MERSDRTLWQGVPSNVLLVSTVLIMLCLSGALGCSLYYFGFRWEIVIGAASFLFLIAIFPAWLQLKFIHYRMTDTTLFIQRGFLNRKTDPVDLFRVLDVGTDEPLLMRLFGVGYVTVYSADTTHPIFKLIGVKDPLAVKELIRKHAAITRQQRGVREVAMQHAP